MVALISLSKEIDAGLIYCMVIQYVHVTGEKQILTVWSIGNASRSVDSKKVDVDVEGPAYQYQKKNIQILHKTSQFTISICSYIY